MRKFLTPFNINKYDAISAYNSLDEIDWTIRTKMKVGDEVYFYCSNPIQKVLMKGVVTKAEVTFDEMIDDSKFYKNEKDVKVDNGRNYIRIKILNIYSKDKSDLLTFEYLKDNGLKGYIQSAQMLDKNKELYDYINKVDNM
ncbi:EVE domain-containing protein [Paraclostridium sordellii]|uniref:EVE domain-containing protein n=1 Tax=Paraclostridium sordellii TaxID=1505 RepID=UPI002902B74E|nr:EVE domain-containing protein [Paeniclostridium sordellii]MDU6249537.1 EVE domain-containing protein [Paeniclostridium sordellii]